jgi:di/tricarboxylate transporter
VNADTIFVFALVAAASILFASGRVRLDVVALLVVIALVLSGVLTEREALAGFGDPVVLLVAGLFIVGEMLTRTGIAYAIGNWIAGVGGESETRLLVVLMLVAAGLGSVMSSTAVVAIFIPVVLSIASKTDINSSRLLMPLSFAALISGMLTLIATTPNLVVSAELRQAGFESFDFFVFTPIGLAVLFVGIVYMLVIGRHLLPGGREEPPKTAAVSMRELADDFDVTGEFHRLRVARQSSLVGSSLRDIKLGTQFNAWVVAVERPQRLGMSIETAPGPDFALRAGDVLVVHAVVADVTRMIETHGLERMKIDDRDRERWSHEIGLATVLIPPESRLAGDTLRKAAFRTRHGLHVVAVRRRGSVLKEFLDEKLESGDSLLLLGSWKRLGQLQPEVHDFLVLALPIEIKQVAPARSRAPVAVAILLGMVLLAALELVPLTAAVLMAALAAVLTRCLTMEEAYRSIHWSSLVLIAGMLPVADALQKTGGVGVIVDGLVSGFGDAGPYAMMTGLFVLTAGLGLFLSNTATAVLMAPIAISAASALGVAPYAFAMTVAIAASAAFATPVSTPVVTLVVAPGRYRFLDFVKVGLPLLVLAWLVNLIITPLVFPF